MLAFDCGFVAASLGPLPGLQQVESAVPCTGEASIDESNAIPSEAKLVYHSEDDEAKLVDRSLDDEAKFVFSSTQVPLDDKRQNK